MTDATKRPAITPEKQERRQDGGADLGSYLEHDQLAADTDRPVPRAQLSRRATAALWVLRIFVIVTGAMVIYSFFSQLGS
jgi:hypothetical protein